MTIPGSSPAPLSRKEIPLCKGCGQRHGNFVATETARGVVTVELADPVLLISVQLLDHFRAGQHVAWWAHYRDDGEEFVKIEAHNGTWIYRIEEQAMCAPAHFARWPD